MNSINILSTCCKRCPGLSGTYAKRNTYVLKRRYPVYLVKKGVEETKMKGRHYVYDLLEDTDCAKKTPVQVILNQYVDGIGQKGQVVSLKRNFAYNKLLLPGLADYATPEAIEKSKMMEHTIQTERASSLYAPMTVKYLEKTIVNVVMNKDVDWTIEPWHVRISFRKAGINVPEKSIEIPSKPIKGPDMNLENKLFLVKVTINNKETARVRCLLHHWSTQIADRLPYIKYPWMNRNEPIFEEEREEIEKLPVVRHRKEPVEI